MPFDQNPKDPLHGITLQNILERLVKRHGWEEMARRVPPGVPGGTVFERKRSRKR